MLIFVDGYDFVVTGLWGVRPTAFEVHEVQRSLSHGGPSVSLLVWWLVPLSLFLSSSKKQDVQTCNFLGLMCREAPYKT